MSGAVKHISGQIEKSEITGAIVADAIAGDKVTKHAILFLNHCDYARLGCGGGVAERGCDSVFVISEVVTQYRTRWLQSEEVSA